VTVNPVVGATAGGGAVTITGTNITGATAIEIGTTAEQQAGTPVSCSRVPVPQPRAASRSAAAPSSSRPCPRVGGLVGLTITVATLGVAGSTGYTYANRPSAPTTPAPRRASAAPR
jgi:hypothetical protein